MTRISKLLLRCAVGLFAFPFVAAHPLETMLGNQGMYRLVLWDVWGVTAILFIASIIELRKLNRMQAEARYLRILKGPDLVQYLLEKRARGEDLLGGGRH
jgi:hypothetical protein